jgi:glutathione/glutaredoxin type arsenate reductase
MAEGFARTIAQTLESEKVEVYSSGLAKSEVDPITVAVMAEIGIDISSQTSKPLSDFNPEDFDAVISLCGCGVNLPKAWVLRDIFEDWQLDDPEGYPMEKFQEVREQVRTRVEALIQIMTA